VVNNLPSVTSPLPPDLRMFIQRVREALDGKGLDGVVTARQMVAAGIASFSATAGVASPVGTVRIDAPSPPTGFTATGAFATIILAWNKATYSGHAYTEIWAAEQTTAQVSASQAPSLSQAVLIGMSAGTTFSHAIGNSATRYYWVKNVNRNGLASAFNATDGTAATTAIDPALTNALLSGAITESMLHADLGAKVDNIAANTVSIGVAEGKYTVKIDNNGYVTGYGLASSTNTSTPTSEFLVRADQFGIASPSGPGITPAEPFIVRTTATTIGGEVIPVGVYMKDTFIQNGTISTAKIGDLAVDTAKIGNAAIVTAKIGTAAVTEAQIDSLAVTTAKIENLGVTNAKIADLAVTTAKIQDANVTTAKIVDANITTAKIADAAITSAKIQDATINTAKIADAAITTAKIGDATITNAKISGQLTVGQVPSLTASKITDLAAVATTGNYSNLTGRPDLTAYATSTQLNHKTTIYYASSDPTTNAAGATLGTGDTGDLYYNTTTENFKRWTGTAWSDISIVADSIVSNYVYAGTLSADKIVGNTLDIGVLPGLSTMENLLTTTSVRLNNWNDEYTWTLTLSGIQASSKILISRKFSMYGNSNSNQASATMYMTSTGCLTGATNDSWTRNVSYQGSNDNPLSHEETCHAIKDSSTGTATFKIRLLNTNSNDRSVTVNSGLRILAVAIEA